MLTPTSTRELQRDPQGKPFFSEVFYEVLTLWNAFRLSLMSLDRKEALGFRKRKVKSCIHLCCAKKVWGHFSPFFDRFLAKAAAQKENLRTTCINLHISHCILKSPSFPGFKSAIILGKEMRQWTTCALLSKLVKESLSERT